MKKFFAIALVLGLFSVLLPVCPAGAAAAESAEEGRTGGEILPVNHDLSVRDIPVTNMKGDGIVTNGTRIGIAVVDETTDLSVKIADDTDEDFYPEHKLWNGIPSVIGAGDNRFIAYYTGGDGEPDNNNYISIAASTDRGETWQNPWMVITASPRGIGWPLFFYNEAGELLLTYGDNKMTGTEMIQFLNADGPLDEIRYTTPVQTGPPMAITCKPTLLSDGCLLSVYGAQTTMVVRSTDGGRTFPDYATISSFSDEKWRTYAEVTIVEKQDGTLWALRRLEYAMGIEQSFSTDGGRSWTRATNDMSVPPFYTPGSRFYMARLRSGNLLFVTNMQGRGTDRRQMTAWLSEDDGETWPYSLVLDPTQSSYPDFWQDEEGLIWLVHDRDRYGEGGIRLHTFTEEDVRAGEFRSEKARKLVNITKKDAEYGDIVDVGGAYERSETFAVGTEIADILEGRPATLRVTDDNGKVYEIAGNYRISNYKKDKAGVYTAYFNPASELPVKLKDGFGMLSFRVVLEEKGGCGSVAYAALPVLAGLVAAVASAAAILRKKSNKGEIS